MGPPFPQPNTSIVLNLPIWILTFMCVPKSQLSSQLMMTKTDVFLSLIICSLIHHLSRSLFVKRLGGIKKNISLCPNFSWICLWSMIPGTHLFSCLFIVFYIQNQRPKFSEGPSKIVSCKILQLGVRVSKYMTIYPCQIHNPIPGCLVSHIYLIINISHNSSASIG